MSAAGPPRAPVGFVLVGAAPFVVALDPGLRRPGVAVWSATLVRAAPGTRRVGVASLLGARVGTERSGRTVRDAVVEVARLVEEIAGIAIRSELLARAEGARVAVAAEYPVAYGTRRAAHDDVGALRSLVEVVTFAAEDTRLRPSEWKGNAPKEVIAARLRGVFAEEFAGGLVDAEHDAIDALGIGAYALGLVGRGCVALARAGV